MTDVSLPIESGPTGEWKLRVGIFLAMCTAFTLWFAYDGFVGYPKKNRDKALQAMPVKPADLALNPRSRMDHLKQAVTRHDEGNPWAMEELISFLGKPGLDQPPILTFTGPQVIATIEMQDGKVLRASSAPVEPAQRNDAPNYRVTPEQVQKITPGMTEQEVGRFLGEPAKREPRRLWFVGPGAFATFEIDPAGMTTGKPSVKPLESSEGDIFIQKVLSGVLAVLSVFMAVKWLRIVRLNVRLDEQGLRYNKQQIPWEAMTRLDTTEYLDKGWVDLLYTEAGETEELRLDSYHIQRWRDIVEAISLRKGFVLPKPPPKDTPDTVDRV